MIRKLLLPAMCAALLGGCVTAGYGYSDGYNDGGYYYGRPAARYYGGASYGYGYPYGSYYGGLYGYPYRYGYGYGGYYGGYPYYYYPHGHYHGDGHHHGDGDHDDDDDHDGGHHGGDHDDDDGDNGGKPPWRRWADDGGDMLRRRQETQPGAVGRLATPSPRQGVVQRPTPRVAAPPRNATPRLDAPPRNFERRAVPDRPARAPAPRARSERELRRGQEP